MSDKYDWEGRRFPPEFQPPPRTNSRPWYQKWYIWALVGMGLITVLALLSNILSSGSEPPLAGESPIAGSDQNQDTLPTSTTTMANTTTTTEPVTTTQPSGHDESRCTVTLVWEDSIRIVRGASFDQVVMGHPCIDASGEEVSQWTQRDLIGMKTVPVPEDSLEFSMEFILGALSEDGLSYEDLAEEDTASPQGLGDYDFSEILPTDPPSDSGEVDDTASRFVAHTCRVELNYWDLLIMEDQEFFPHMAEQDCLTSDGQPVSEWINRELIDIRTSSEDTEDLSEPPWFEFDLGRIGEYPTYLDFLPDLVAP